MNSAQNLFVFFFSNNLQTNTSYKIGEKSMTQNGDWKNITSRIHLILSFKVSH
jgi:hypothetical protein